jgi:hypothetical protein
MQNVSQKLTNGSDVLLQFCSLFRFLHKVYETLKQNIKL